MTIHRKGPPTEQLQNEYLDGATSTELAKKYGMSPTAINHRLNRFGTVMRPARRRSLHDHSSAEVVSAYQNGMSMADIARNSGVTHSTVQRTISMSGVKIRPHGTHSRSVRIPSGAINLGYLCGLFDGEGNLQFRNKHKGRSISAKLAIYSTTPGVMQWLLRNIGGKVRYDTKRTEAKGWLPIGIWNLYRAQDVAALLKAMLPHLIVKKRAAESALRLFQSRFEIQDSPPQITQSR